MKRFPVDLCIESLVEASVAIADLTGEGLRGKELQRALGARSVFRRVYFDLGATRLHDICLVGLRAQVLLVDEVVVRVI